MIEDNLFEEYGDFYASVINPRKDEIQKNEGVKQQSREWFNSRLGKFTASRMPDLLGRGRGKLFGNKAINYVNEVMIERTLSEKGKKIYVDQQMGREFVQTRWGNEYEAYARTEAEKILGTKLSEVTFRKGFAPYFGGSADFQTADGMPGEIKCPFNISIHQQNVDLMNVGLDRKHTYYAQIQAHILNFNSDKCFFVSYDPRRDKDNQTAIIVVNRDNEFIEEMKMRLEKAEAAIQHYLLEKKSIDEYLNN